MPQAKSTRSASELGPSLSLEGGASGFTIGEYVLVRIPEEIQVEGCVDNEATVVGTDLPPTSNGSSPQHFAFIRQVILLPDNSYTLEVYPVVAFTRRGGAVLGYNELTDAGKAELLPLPNLSFRHPTPDAFGTPLNFGNWSTFRDSFLHVIPLQFVMPTKRPFKRMIPPLIMSVPVLFRIDHYREYLRSNTRHGQTGGWGGQVAPGTTSVTSSPTIIGDGGGERAAGMELEQFSIKSPHDLLVLEGVDEDAEDADATMRDELVILARDNPIWKEELRRYLQREEKEKEQVQKERVERLARWRKDIAVQPT